MESVQEFIRHTIDSLMMRDKDKEDDEVQITLRVPPSLRIKLDSISTFLDHMPRNKLINQFLELSADQAMKELSNATAGYKFVGSNKYEFHGSVQELYEQALRQYQETGTETLTWRGIMEDSSKKDANRNNRSYSVEPGEMVHPDNPDNKTKSKGKSKVREAS